MSTMQELRGDANRVDPEPFYSACLELLAGSGIPFLLAGTHAVNVHTGFDRPVRDLDVFCKPDDRAAVLERFARHGYRTETRDERWLAKIWQGPYFADLISNSSGGVAPITDSWFAEVHTTRLYGIELRVLPPTELVWSKLFVQDRYRYDGADVAHVILRQAGTIDWQRLLGYAERHWEVLLAHLINFRFVYPTERDCVPRWVLEELLGRLGRDLAGPPPVRRRVCRGRFLSPADYEIDVTRWGFVDADDEREAR